MIEAEALHKRYGEHQAVERVDLSVPEGRILGVLGPNGAGKSTTVRMLTTMTVPDGGVGRVGGFDVVREAHAVRRIIGVTGQDATLDELLTGTQNLVMVGELGKLSRREAQRRAADLLEEFELTGAAGRMVKTYSGGMRRRLDLAASLIARPPVFFLDEPTTGLDPASRQRMWDVIRGLVADGATVLLTTQYLDEADALADSISVIDHGRVIAAGTAAELKARVGGERVELTLTRPHPAAADALAPLVDGPVHVTEDGRRLKAPVVAREGIATEVIRRLDDTGVAVDDIAIHRPSLDDVFFALTGRPAEPPEVAPDAEVDEVDEVDEAADAVVGGAR
jgi:daunorubicin resistance ABC transporter ATP-binding subunit